MTSPSLLVLNNLDRQDKMQNLNHPVHPIANFNLADLSPSSPESSSLADRHRQRVASGTSLGSAGPSATDLHDPLAEHVRNRPGSGSKCAFDEDNGANGSGRNTPPSRLGTLLRNHHRASSLSQSQIQGASFCALRFKYSSSTSSSAKARNGLFARLAVNAASSPSSLDSSLRKVRGSEPMFFNVDSSVVEIIVGSNVLYDICLTRRGIGDNVDEFRKRYNGSVFLHYAKNLPFIFMDSWPIFNDGSVTQVQHCCGSKMDERCWTLRA
ncbi:hypothetical protein PILCRDRAFT_12090 [Piloderma croceum F 1598]|uniref:Uncharacterized protein n=1 Tax=Piloderma croceum (strain F 1598) TaxID=765440 RepID=A0A0C3FC65_PILCF|nr:hypothetical protein PILCRDRAFT_12090 [Piloderma croceum F 1598]